MRRATFRLWNAMFVVGTVVFSSQAFADGQERGGGILASAQFVSAGHEAIRLLAIGDPTMNSKEILAQIEHTKVIPVEKLCYPVPSQEQQTFCEAAHYDAASNVVLFAYKNWLAMTCREKMTLSAHEFFRAAGIEGEDYTFSGRFLTRRYVVEGAYAASEAADRFMTIRRGIEVLCESISSANWERLPAE